MSDEERKMNKYRLALCDDDPILCDDLQKKIRGLYENVDVEIYYSPRDLEERIQRQEIVEPQILIMDIKFDGEDGISVVKRMQQKYHLMKVIYLTGYIDYARDIFETELIYFLTKPVDVDKLQEAIRRAINHIDRERRDEIVVENNHRIHRIMLATILYVESERRNLYIHTMDGDISCLMKIGDFQKNLGDAFLRCHQSYLVNMEHISRMDKSMITMDNGVEIPVSRRYAEDLRQQFMNYMGNHLY